MTRPRTPAGVLTALALLGLLAACTSSGAGGGKHAAGGSSAAPSGSSPAAGSGVAPSGAGASGASTAPTTGATTTVPAPEKPVRSMTIQGAHATFTIRVWSQVKTRTCAGHAYGTSVVAFLRQHPCAGLTRLLATTIIGKRAVGLAQSNVTFAGPTKAASTAATDFTVLLGRKGAGNLTDLFRDGRRLPSGPTSIPATSATNARNDSTTATVVAVWYLKGRTPQDDPALSELTEALSS